jgi:hypothetical protein
VGHSPDSGQGAGYSMTTPKYIAREWTCYAETSVGYEVAGRFVQVAECSGFGHPPDEAVASAAQIVAALNGFPELRELAKLAYRALCDAEAVINTIDGECVLESMNLEELQGRIGACAGNLFTVLRLPTSEFRGGTK